LRIWKVITPSVSGAASAQKRALPESVASAAKTTSGGGSEVDFPSYDACLRLERHLCLLLAPLRRPTTSRPQTTRKSTSFDGQTATGVLCIHTALQAPPSPRHDTLLCCGAASSAPGPDARSDSPQTLQHPNRAARAHPPAARRDSGVDPLGATKAAASWRRLRRWRSRRSDRCPRLGFSQSAAAFRQRPNQLVEICGVRRRARVRAILRNQNVMQRFGRPPLSR